MKVRFTGRGVRVRIDDLELAALLRGEVLELTLAWAEGEGGWSVRLDPAGPPGVSGAGGALLVGLQGALGDLQDPAQEGVTLQGAASVRVEKDFGPQHLP